jgi:hypothetical protein
MVDDAAAGGLNGRPSRHGGAQAKSWDGRRAVMHPCRCAHGLSQWAPDVGGHADELVNASTAGMVE